MKRIKFWMIVLLPAAWGLFASFQRPAAPAPSGAFTVVIDAGHGGKDPGAVGKISYEKNLALSISKLVQKKLDANGGYKCLMTRSTDVYVGLKERAQLANKNHADLFVSIHLNANENREAYGTETYAVGVHKNKAQLDVMMRENASILYEDNYEEKYDGFDPKSEESYIIFKLQQHAHLKQSLKLAKHIEDEFESRAGRHSRGVKQAGFLVLWQSAMPAVLVEGGFVSNAAEEKFLNTKAGQEKLADSIYRAVKQYRKEQAAG